MLQVLNEVIDRIRQELEAETFLLGLGESAKLIEER